MWCLYHCQYECPCKSYKSPLDYAPDRNIKRAMPKCKKEALRSGGGRGVKASPKKSTAGGGGPSLAGRIGNLGLELNQFNSINMNHSYCTRLKLKLK